MIAQAAREVFVHPPYLALAAVLGLLTYASLAWLSNYRLIAAVLAASGVALGTKLRLLMQLFTGFVGSLDWVAMFSAFAIPVLLGIDIAMIVYFLRRRSAALPRGEIAAGAGGAASGALVAGCTACGSFLLITFLSLFGAAGALALLPLKGEELSLVSIALLLFSIYLIARRIMMPLVCAVPTGPEEKGMSRAPGERS
jgi:hypothetical protein